MPGNMRRLAYAQNVKATVKHKGGARMIASRDLAIWCLDMGARRQVVADKGSVVHGPNWAMRSDVSSSLGKVFSEAIILALDL